MSKLDIYKQALHTYTLIVPTLAVWSALLLTIIAVFEFSCLIKWLLVAVAVILVVATVICAKRWSRLFTLYHKILSKEEKSKNKHHDVKPIR